MDNTQNGTQTTGSSTDNSNQPAPITPPAPPQEPVNAESQPSQTPPASPASPLSQPADNSKSKKLLWAIVVGVVVLLAVFLVYTFFFSPQALAKKAANAYMTAAAAGDADKLVEITEADSASAKSFQESAAASLKGEYELIDKGSKDGTWYFLYKLSGAKSNYARVTVEKQDSGAWEVTSLVYGKDKLVLIPTKSSSSTKTEKTVPEPAPTQQTQTQPSTAALACLVQDDYRYFNYNKQPSTVIFDTTYDPAKFTKNKTDEMFFKPDSTTEDSFTSIYDTWADFAKHAENKQWKFRLEGSVYGSDSASAASKQLANDRALKVKAQLVQRGVPESRFVIDPPHDYSSEVQNATDRIYRRVQILIDPTCSTTNAR